MTKAYNGWVINTGFLGGNILSGYDERPVDEAASCARYKDMLHEALEKEFPGADIRIHYEVMASGATPAPMRTYVRTPDGMEYYPGDDHEAGAMAARVNDICGEVWESWEWVVYEFVEEMTEQEFAELLGFDSYESLMEASESVVSEGDIDWYVTRLPDGRWAAWDDAELEWDRVEYFDTREEAEAFHLTAYADKYGEE